MGGKNTVRAALHSSSPDFFRAVVRAGLWWSGQGTDCDSQNNSAGPRGARAVSLCTPAPAEPGRQNRSEARTARSTRRSAGPGGGLRLHRQQAFALHALARKLARPADRFRLLARFLFGGLFVVAAELHLAEDALALHLLLQRFESLIDVIITDENLHASFLCCGPVWSWMCRSPPIRAKARRAGSRLAAPVAESTCGVHRLEEIGCQNSVIGRQPCLPAPTASPVAFRDRRRPMGPSPPA